MMTSIDRYRANAENCLRLAHEGGSEWDKPLWLTLAQSWLRLAEHADQGDTPDEGDSDGRYEERAVADS
jgi:hypothetical protein